MFLDCNSKQRQSFSWDWVVLIQLSAQAAFIESNLIWSRYNQQRLSLKLSLRFPKNSPKSLSYRRNQGFDFYCYLQGVERGNTGWVNGKGVFLVSCHSVLYEDILKSINRGLLYWSKEVFCLHGVNSSMSLSILDWQSLCMIHACGDPFLKRPFSEEFVR